MATNSTAGADSQGKQGKQRKQGKLAQIRATYRMTKKADRKLPLVLLGTFVGVLAIFVLLGLVFIPWFMWFTGVLTATLATLLVFGRRAERAAYSQIAGQPGAAAAVLNSLRRGWTVTPAIALNKNQDLVHRATGRPGVVLIAEGSTGGARALLAQEKKRMSRIAPDVPVHEFLVGDGDGRIPLTKLQRTIMKLPRLIKPAQAAQVERRLKAMGGVSMPVPKGPLPKGARMPRPPSRGR